MEIGLNKLIYIYIYRHTHRRRKRGQRKWRIEGDGMAYSRKMKSLKMLDIWIFFFFFFFWERDNYVMQLISQFKPFSPTPITLYMGRCQFSYKILGIFEKFYAEKTLNWIGCIGLRWHKSLCKHILMMCLFLIG